MKLTRAEGLAWREIDQETVIIHLSERKMYGLNESGGRMWSALSKPNTIEGLGLILAEDEAERSNVIEAVERFINDLAQEGLVTSDEPLAGRGPEAEVVDITLPKIEWREEIRQFAGQCNFQAGQSLQCNQQPGAS